MPAFLRRRSAAGTAPRRSTAAGQGSVTQPTVPPVGLASGLRPVPTDTPEDAGAHPEPGIRGTPLHDQPTAPGDVLAGSGVPDLRALLLAVRQVLAADLWARSRMAAASQMPGRHPAFGGQRRSGSGSASSREPTLTRSARWLGVPATAPGPGAPASGHRFERARCGHAR